MTARGIILDKDSLTPMAFAYAVDKTSGSGTLTDDKGRFSLPIRLGDTLSFSYLGYSMTRIATGSLKDSVKNSVLTLHVVLKPKATELRPVVIAPASFSKEVKESYAQKISEYYRGISAPLASPISAMYYAWSKKGKELQKLSGLYQQLLMDEVREHRLSDQKIRALTGNDTLNVKEFTNFCFLPDQFVASASDYDLYLAVHRCYREYLEMRRTRK